MQLSKDDPLVQTAVFGRRVEEFVSGEIGRYITRRAADEIEDLTEQLKRTSPAFWWGRRKIARIQSQIAIAERVIRWLADAITEGQQATQALEDAND